MIPFFRSLNELMVITQPGYQESKVSKQGDDIDIQKDKNKKSRLDCTRDIKIIQLPDIPKTTRRKWIKSKKALSRLLDELDYNNQTPSTYELTLIERQNNIERQDVA